MTTRRNELLAPLASALGSRACGFENRSSAPNRKAYTHSPKARPKAVFDAPSSARFRAGPARGTVSVSGPGLNIPNKLRDSGVRYAFLGKGDNLVPPRPRGDRPLAVGEPAAFDLSVRSPGGREGRHSGGDPGRTQDDRDIGPASLSKSSRTGAGATILFNCATCLFDLTGWSLGRRCGPDFRTLHRPGKDAG